MIIFFLFISSFLLAHIFNYISYFARISGKNIGFSLLGTSLAGIIIGLSQLSLLFFIPSLSFLIEKMNLKISKDLNDILKKDLKTAKRKAFWNNFKGIAVGIAAGVTVGILAK